MALRLIRRLADEGVGVVLISHYLNEIFEVCDDLTVMRDGEVVADGPVAATNAAAGGQRHGRPAAGDIAAQARLPSRTPREPS